MNESIEFRLNRLMNEASNLVESKNYQDAELACAEVLHYCPGFPDALHIKGIASYELGRNDTAIELIRSAINNSPEIPAYYISLARVYKNDAKYMEAITACNTALKMDPDSYQAYEILSTINRDIGDLEKAIDNLDDAIKLQPDNIGLKCKRAIYIAESGNIPTALELCKSLQEEYSDNPDIHYYAGYIHELNHDIQEAVEQYNAAIDARPENLGPYMKLANIGSGQGDKEVLINKLEGILQQGNASNYESISINFLLGKLYDDIGVYDKAFYYYESGNESVYLTNNYSREENTLYINRIIQTFTANLFQRFGDAGHGSELPVFIVGMPRSGTSLVEQILSCHTDIYAAGELSYVPLMTKHMHENLQTTRKYPRCVKSLTVETIYAFAEDYVNKIRNKSGAALRITDKLPANFLHIGFIFMMFPRAKIIHCQRDPMDVCISNYMQMYSTPQPYTYNLEDLGYYYLDYERLMIHWNNLFPDKILNLKYEDLVSNTEKTARSMLAYCDLPWQDGCLSPHKNKRHVRTASYAQVRNPVYKSSMNRWKHYEKHLGPLKEILTGYY